MKILVTGGAGFIASHVVDAYLALGHQVVVVDNLSSGKKENLNPQAKFYQADITSPELNKVLAKEKPQLVNHHAAQIDVRKSVADPFYDINVNVQGTVNVLLQCQKYGVKKIIFSSTGGALYGEVPTGRAKENHAIVPISPYAIDKRAAEMYLQAFFINFGLKFTILRYGNVYGPRQDPHGEAGVVAIFCGKVLMGEAPNIFGDGQQVRDYVFVKDVVEANRRALKKGDGKICNVGTGVGTSVNQLYAALRKVTGQGEDAVYRPARLGELMRNVLDNYQARRILGWQPKFNIQKGLKETYRWFKSKA